MSVFQRSAVTTRDGAVESCDVCIVGAGIAGLNALFAASRYLSRDQKVILIDRRARVGGMWVDTYPYVRLHQPHPMFTAGNIKWTLGQDRSYLATKGQVLDHFQHCLNVIQERVQVDEYLGWAFESDDEVDGIVRVTCRSSDGHSLVIEATDESGSLHQAAECTRLGRWLFIAKSVADNPSLRWPKDFLHYSTTRVLINTSEILQVLRAN